jgi:hypothetical protein
VRAAFELLRKAEKANGGGDVRKHPSQRASGAKTLKQLAISLTQSSRWQQLAENPKAVERYVREVIDAEGGATSHRPWPADDTKSSYLTGHC